MNLGLLVIFTDASPLMNPFLMQDLRVFIVLQETLWTPLSSVVSFAKMMNALNIYFGNMIHKH